jgi:nitrate/nitrite transporter NarK
MNSTAYRLIGFVVWRALKWYLRELMPSRRRIALSFGLLAATAVAAGALLRRLTQ